MVGGELEEEKRSPAAAAADEGPMQESPLNSEQRTQKESSMEGANLASEHDAHLPEPSNPQKSAQSTPSEGEEDVSSLRDSIQQSAKVLPGSAAPPSPCSPEGSPEQSAQLPAYGSDRSTEDCLDSPETHVSDTLNHPLECPPDASDPSSQDFKIEDSDPETSTTSLGLAPEASNSFSKDFNGRLPLPESSSSQFIDSSKPSNGLPGEGADHLPLPGIVSSQSLESLESPTRLPDESTDTFRLPEISSLQSPASSESPTRLPEEGADHLPLPDIASSQSLQSVESPTRLPDEGKDPFALPEVSSLQSSQWSESPNGLPEEGADHLPLPDVASSQSLQSVESPTRLSDEGTGPYPLVELQSSETPKLSESPNSLTDGSVDPLPLPNISSSQSVEPVELPTRLPDEGTDPFPLSEISPSQSPELSESPNSLRDGAVDPLPLPNISTSQSLEPIESSTRLPDEGTYPLPLPRLSSSKSPESSEFPNLLADEIVDPLPLPNTSSSQSLEYVDSPTRLPGEGTEPSPLREISSLQSPESSECPNLLAEEVVNPLPLPSISPSQSLEFVESPTRLPDDGTDLSPLPEMSSSQSPECVDTSNGLENEAVDRLPLPNISSSRSPESLESPPRLLGDGADAAPNVQESSKPLPEPAANHQNLSRTERPAQTTAREDLHHLPRITSEGPPPIQEWGASTTPTGNLPKEEPTSCSSPKSLRRSSKQTSIPPAQLELTNSCRPSECARQQCSPEPFPDEAHLFTQRISPPTSHSSRPSSVQLSIDVEPHLGPAAAHGAREEDNGFFQFASSSLPFGLWALLSEATNAVVDVLVPPLPPESSSGASSETRHGQLNAADNDLRSNQRGHVSFAGGDSHGTEISAGPLQAPEDRPRARPRKLSSRFYQSPIESPRKEYTVRETFYIAYQTLGVVYGDLGTSPLYVYPTINITDPSERVYLGIFSVIFWTLTLIGVLKYTLIVLQADDHGEGGTFAMYSLLCQHANIDQHEGEKASVEDMAGRRLSHLCKLEDQNKQSPTKVFLENNLTAQKTLLFIVLLATCMLIGDGILTPAISVISAIEGIQTAAPTLSRAVIVIISAIILVLLFLLQKYGTHRVSLLFSPIMAAWLITTPLIGIYNIATYYPRIFKAFSPAYVVYFFRDDSKHAWLMLGGTVLCITGAEAMYADMGHFNKRSIQVAFCLMVYPSVLLTYAGQTSYLIAHPKDHKEGYYKAIPKKVYWPMFIISTLAAIVASQGLISATFSVIKQSVAMDYFPRVKVVHTSDDKEGQVYSPEVNYILMILCLAVVFGFRSSTMIGNAFGVAVVFVMLITTCLTCLVMLVIWKCRPAFVIAFLLLLGILETTYISSVVTKVPQGGWLPFMISMVVTLTMVAWHSGCQAKYRYEMNNQITKQAFGAVLDDVGSVRVPGICFFYTDLMSGVPPIVQHYVSNVRSFHRVLVFTTVRFLPVKTVLPAERFLVGRAGFDGVYRCVARYGYRDVMKIQNNEFLDQFLATLTEYLRSNDDAGARRRSLLSDDDADVVGRSRPRRSIDADIVELQQAREHGAVYVMGRGELKVGKHTKLLTRLLVGHVYKFLRANCRSEVSTMDIPFAQYLEIGMVYHI